MKQIVSTVLAVVALALIALGVWWYMHSHSTPKVVTLQTEFDSNNLKDALARADKQLLQSPNDSNALAQKAIILAQMGSLEFKEKEYGAQAVTLAEKATKADAKNSEAWRVLGYAHEIQQQYTQAHEAYSKAIELDPQNAAAIFSDAHTYDLEGNLAKAEAGYKTALVADPNLDTANTGLARVLAAKGDRDGALSALKLAYESSTNAHRKAEDAYSMSVLLNSKGDSAAALPYAQAATKLDPSYPLGWHGLGTTLFLRALDKSSKATQLERGEMIKESMADLNKALNLNPHQSLALLQAANESAFIGNKAESAGLFIKAAEAVPLDITLSASEKTATLKLIAATRARTEAIQKAH